MGNGGKTEVRKTDRGGLGLSGDIDSLVVGVGVLVESLGV